MKLILKKYNYKTELRYTDYLNRNEKTSPQQNLSILNCQMTEKYCLVVPLNSHRVFPYFQTLGVEI